MKAIERHPDGSKSYYLIPIALSILVINAVAVAVAVVWLCIQMWRLVL